MFVKEFIKKLEEVGYPDFQIVIYDKNRRQFVSVADIKVDGRHKEVELIVENS